MTGLIVGIKVWIGQNSGEGRLRCLWDITQRTRLADWLARQAAKEAHEGGGWGLLVNRLRRVRV